LVYEIDIATRTQNVVRTGKSLLRVPRLRIRVTISEVNLALDDG